MVYQRLTGDPGTMITLLLSSDIIVRLSSISVVWFCRDNLSRLDGPAIQWSDGTESYYVLGQVVPRKRLRELGLA